MPDGGVVLVMDDEDFIREIAGEMLLDAGFTYAGAVDGEEAVRLVKSSLASPEGERISVAVLDLTVPTGMGGLEAAGILKELAPDIRLVASSGFCNDPAMSNPQENGFDASIRKPYRQVEFIELLKRIL